jgi:rod shape determining protein RodA
VEKTVESIKKSARKLDLTVFLIMFVLICIGLYCVRQADICSAAKEGLFTKQFMGAVIGLVMVIVILFIDYRFICSMSPILYIGIIIVLACTLLFGKDINDVRRWITIGKIQLQPSELAKVVLIVFLSYLCNCYKNKMDKLYVFFILAAAAAVPAILILLEPHLSTSLVILFVFCIIVYASGLSYKVICLALAASIPVIVGIIVSVGVFNINIPFIKPYHIKRILTFFSEDEFENEDGKYQQNRSIVSIAAGGKSGKLLSGDTSDRKYVGIYANESDFIFTIVGEEFGFIGSSVIVILYFILFLRCLIIAAHAPDYMGKLICIGVSALLMFQTFVNIGVATNLLPNTGLPLPFISYGLTSLISSMASIGLVLNVGIRQTGKRY